MNRIARTKPPGNIAEFPLRGHFAEITASVNHSFYDDLPIKKGESLIIKRAFEWNEITDDTVCYYSKDSKYWLIKGKDLELAREQIKFGEVTGIVVEIRKSRSPQKKPQRVLDLTSLNTTAGESNNLARAIETFDAGVIETLKHTFQNPSLIEAVKEVMEENRERLQQVLGGKQ